MRYALYHIDQVITGEEKEQAQTVFDKLLRQMVDNRFAGSIDEMQSRSYDDAPGFGEVFEHDFN